MTQRTQECRAGGLRLLPGFFLSVLHDLFHEVPHGLGGFVLLLPGGVGIGAQSEPGIEVPQHGGHRLYIHAVLQGSGGERVPEIVKPEMLQSGVLQDLFVGLTTLSGWYISPVRGEGNR